MIKEEPIQRLERFTRPTVNRPSKFCGVSNWTPLHIRPAIETNCVKCGKRGHYAKVCRRKDPNNQTVKRLTEDKPHDRSETSSESNGSVHSIKEKEKIEEKANTTRQQ